MRGTVYDMAMHATDTLLDAGLLPFSKVQRTSKNRPATSNLGEHQFKPPTPTPPTRPAPASSTRSTVHHASNSSSPAKNTSSPRVREQLKRQRNTDGAYRIYGHWAIPVSPAPPTTSTSHEP